MTTEITCSFCGKTNKEVKTLIKSSKDGIAICNSCIDICVQVMYPDGSRKTSTQESTDTTDIKNITPEELYAHLNQYVVGQDQAKKIISVLVANHYKRLLNPEVDGTMIEKSNAIMVGPSGSGKTLLATAIAKYLDVPSVVVDATSITEAGYIGEDVESILMKLLQNAGGDVKKAERGIVFIDECDKKAKRTTNSGRDVSGEGVQQALLKMIEGTDVNVPTTPSKKSQDFVKMNTSNILFIIGGAFVGIKDIVIKKMNEKKGFGMTAKATVTTKTISEEELISKIGSEHFEEYGMIPELIGRVPVVIPLATLTVEQMKDILTVPKNCIVKQYQAMFSLSGASLQFDDAALTKLAETAVKAKTGARTLRGMIERLMTDTQFNLQTYVKEGKKNVLVTVVNNNFEIILT